jgi:hypothetical protein
MPKEVAPRALLFLVVCAIALLEGCMCRKKSDEDKLKAMIDATPVHLWLSAKIAMHPDEGSAETRDARRAIKTLIHAAQKKDPSAADITPKDAASMAVALWQLRSMGKDAFKKNKRDVPKPVLAAMVDPSLPLEKVLDANMEHGLFLIGLTIAKVHPKLAVPVPPEVLLYEAWWADASELTLNTFAPIVRGFKAYVYGTSELCDLADKESSAIPTDGALFSAASLSADLALLTGEKVKLTEDQSDHSGAAIAALANGATALCYFKRDEPEKANPALKRMLDAADRLGIEDRGTIFLRGYVECAEGDANVGEKNLKKIIDDKAAPERLRNAAEILLTRCGKKGAMAKSLDRVALAAAISMIALHHLEETGVVDAVGASRVARAIVGFTAVVGGSLDKAKASIPGYDDAKGFFSK